MTDSSNNEKSIKLGIWGQIFNHCFIQLGFDNVWKIIYDFLLTQTPAYIIKNNLHVKNRVTITSGCKIFSGYICIFKYSLKIVTKFSLIWHRPKSV